MEQSYIKQALQFEPNSEQYQQILERLCQPQMIRILHGLIGLTTECGELFDQYKKHIFYGKELDLVNLSEEIGDVDWYRAVLVDALAILRETDSDLLNEDIYKKNIAKLTARYGNKFSEQSATQRDLARERVILECDCTESCSCCKDE